MSGRRPWIGDPCPVCGRPIASVFALDAGSGQRTIEYEHEAVADTWWGSDSPRPSGCLVQLDAKEA